MKLVGATNWFVRLPFLLEVVIYSVLAWLVNLGILYGTLYFAEPYLNRFFEGAGALTLTGYFNANFLMYFGGMLAGLIALNIISAGLAMRRYLKI
jgi:cell division transport system permease protein